MKFFLNKVLSIFFLVLFMMSLLVINYDLANAEPSDTSFAKGRSTLTYSGSKCGPNDEDLACATANNSNINHDANITAISGGEKFNTCPYCKKDTLLNDISNAPAGSNSGSGSNYDPSGIGR